MGFAARSERVRPLDQLEVGRPIQERPDNSKKSRPEADRYFNDRLSRGFENFLDRALRLNEWGIRRQILCPIETLDAQQPTSDPAKNLKLQGKNRLASFDVKSTNPDLSLHLPASQVESLPPAGTNPILSPSSSAEQKTGLIFSSLSRIASIFGAGQAGPTSGRINPATAKMTAKGSPSNLLRLAARLRQMVMNAIAKIAQQQATKIEREEKEEKAREKKLQEKKRLLMLQKKRAQEKARQILIAPAYETENMAPLLAR